MNVYAIIVTYNAMRRQWIDRCLESLRQCTHPVTPVVVDNCSTDGTREHVPAHYPDAVWLPQDTNLGFGQANNVGIRYAITHHADYVLLLNQDATIHPQALELMLEQSDGQSLISPLHLNGDGSAFDNNFCQYTLKAAPNDLFDDLIVRHAPRGSYPIGEVAAACWLMPVSIIQTIGGFNPLFFQYGEDNNYYQRIVYHKIPVRLVPGATICHDRQQQGDQQAFNNKLFHRQVLKIACNINSSAIRRIADFILLLSPRHSVGIRTILREVLWLITHAKAIAQSRKKEKQKGTTWLQ